MPRRPKQDRPVDRHVALPKSLDERLNEYLRDPVTGKPQGRSRTIERAVREFLDGKGY